MTTARRRVAVIGCGDIAAVHLAAIAALPAAELVAVCDPDPGRLAAAEAAWSVPGFRDHLALLGAVRPDVVHVCTPPSTHAPIAIDALDAGVHVVLEKPLAHSREQGRRLVEAAAAAAARIAICFQNRYNAPVQAARELLSSGALGVVHGASATVFWHRDAAYYADRPWRGRWATAGGGLLMNQAIHTIDLLQWLLGDVIEVEDTADLVLRHASGATSTIFATLSHVRNDPVTVEIVTEGGTLTLRGDLTVTYADGRMEVVPERVLPGGARAYWGVSHELLIQDFYAGLDSGAPFWIDPRAAQASLDIIQDVYDQAFPSRSAVAPGAGGA